MGRSSCAFFFVLLALLCRAVLALESCEIVISGADLSERFVTELALTEVERTVGLMGRRRLAPHHAMLFDFDEERGVSMWMKDTLISLDMAFFRSDGTLAYLEKAATPGSLKKITPPMPIRYVVEFNAGASRLLHSLTPVKLDMARLTQCLGATAPAATD